MSIPSPLQQYHFHVILIWWHSPFKVSNQKDCQGLIPAVKLYFTKKECSGLIPAVEGQGGCSTSQSPSAGQPTAFSPEFPSNLVDAFKKTSKTTGDKKTIFFLWKTK